MESLALHPVFSSTAAAFLVWGSVAAVSFFLIGRDVRFSGRRRLLFLLLRTLFLLLFALLLFRPSIVSETVRQLPAASAILLDVSESMSIRDFDGQPRFEAVRHALRLGRSTGRDEIFSFFEFDGDYAQLTSDRDLPDEPKGAASALGRALDGVLDRFAGERLLGVFLVSDGVERSNGAVPPQEAALRYRDAGVPIYTCCIGSTEGVHLRDVSVGGLTVPTRVYLGNEVTVTGLLRMTGYRGTSLPLVFRVEGKDVARQEFTAVSDEETLPFRFSYTCDEPGERRLTVSADGLPGEITPMNNASDAYIRFVPGKLNVLFLEGTRRFEDKFIRMALAAKQEIRVDYVRLSEGEKPQFAKEYSAIIFGNVDPTDLDDSSRRALMEILSDGAGLIFLPGLDSIAENKLGETPFASMAPVLLPEETLAPELAEKGFLDRPVHVRPAEGAGVHYLASLAADAAKSKKLWAELPPLESVLDINSLRKRFSKDFGIPKPGSEIILEGADDAGNIVPVLIVGSHAHGRSALLLTDATWRWAMSKGRSTFETFWRQLILWVAGHDALAPGELDAEMESTSLWCGETARARIVYMPFHPETPEAIAVTASVTKPDGSSQMVPIGDDQTAAFAGTDLAGEYLLRVCVTENGKQTEETCRFTVKENRLELESPAAATGMMRNIAEMTGGEVVAPEALADFYRKMLEKRETVIDRVFRSRPLCSHWLFFVLGIGLFTGEWLLCQFRGRG